MDDSINGGVIVSDLESLGVSVHPEGRLQRTLTVSNHKILREDRADKHVRSLLP